MIMVTGGRGAGKHSFVLQHLGFSEQDISTDPFDEKPVLSNLHEVIRARGCLDDELSKALQRKAVIICAEVGGGVVPLDPEERRWRDAAGSAAAALAVDASVVVRLVCGIPQLIKGSL